MFTGIIEEIGSITAVKRGKVSSTLTISGSKVFGDLCLGDSVAVNGVCLTVAELGSGIFTADVMHETLRRSSLGSLRAGSAVNLERAMIADGRFGGHIVSGHIDGCGKIVRIERDDNAIWYTIATEAGILRYIVEKGSVALDGISLTVARLGGRDFDVSIIPHTASQTILSQRRVGDVVNIENDVIGKYVERLLGFVGPGTANAGSRAGLGSGAGRSSGLGSNAGAGRSAGSGAAPNSISASGKGLTAEFLVQNGF